MNATILLVDDEQNVLSGYKRHLRKLFDVETALSGKEGLALLERSGPFAVIVSDMNMPEMNGVEFLSEAKKKAPDSVRLMLTGNADQQTAVDAVNLGNVFRFVNKPCPPETLIKILKISVRQYELITAERELLEQTLNGVIKALTDILSMIVPDAFGRAMTLRDAAKKVAQGFGIEDSWALEMAAMLAPVGLVTIPPEIVLKKRYGKPLSEKEQETLHYLPQLSNKLLGNIPRLERVAKIIQYHQKCYDGSGFPPDDTAAEEIPIESRILKVLFDLSDLEQSGLSHSAALKQLAEASGFYDPEVLAAINEVARVHPVEVAPTVEVKLWELRPGHNLVGNIEAVDGKLLVAAGQQLSAATIERLRNFSRLVEIKEPIAVQPLTTRKTEAQKQTREKQAAVVQ